MLPKLEGGRPARRAKWRSGREILGNLVAAVVVSAVVYYVAGQSFLFFGQDSAVGS
jgi:hypothetical protein